MHVPKAGRNDLCPCGSGKKYKRCHEQKAKSQRASLAMLLLVGLILAGAVFVGVKSFGEESSSIAAPGRTWSVEHGHYH